MTGQQTTASRRHDADERKRHTGDKRGRKNAKKRGLGQMVERGTEGIERFHRAVASLPLDALERVERLEKPISRVRKLQERSIRATYELVRGVNREVTQLVRDTSKRRRQQRRTTVHRSERPKPKKVVHDEATARAS